MLRIVTDNNLQKRLIECVLYDVCPSLCKDLLLDNLKEIVVSSDISSETAGSYSKGTMKLNRDCINRTINCINGDYEFINNVQSLDVSIQIFIDTIIHELFHCDAEYNMPQFHRFIYNDLEDAESLWKKCIIHYWIECFVKYSSERYYFVHDKELINQISNLNWNIKCFHSSSNKRYEKMSHLIYISSYYVPLYLSRDYNEEYLELVRNQKIRALYKSLIYETNKLLDLKTYIDEYSRLVDIEKLFKDYYYSIYDIKFCV